MKFSVLIIFCLTCGTLGNPINTAITNKRQSREIDLLANTRNLVTELIKNLGDAADQARRSVDIFRDGLSDQAKSFEVRVQNEIRKLRASVSDAISDLTDALGGAVDDVTTCIQTALQSAEDLLAEILAGTMSCGEELLTEVQDLIQTQLRLTDEATLYSRRSSSDLKKCYNNTPSTDIIGLGRCVGGIAVQAQLKSTGFFAQNALLVGRINFSLVSIPARLDMCVISELVGAVKDVGSIIEELLSCSGSAISNAFVGSEDSDNSETDGSETDGSDTDTEGSDNEDTDTEGSDNEDTDTEGSDAEGSDTEDSDTEGSDTEGSDTDGSDTEDSDTESTADSKTPAQHR